MNENLRIAVADDEADMRQYFGMILPRLGHEVVAVAENGQQLIEACRLHQPDLVVTDIRMPEMDGIAAASAIYEHRPIPVILVSAFHDPDLIARAEQNHVLAYLIKPIKRENLQTAISITMARFRTFEALRKEATDLRQALADRKVIERAKGLLMEKAGLSEADAFRRLQRLASDRNLKLIEVANSLILAEEALQGE